MRAEDDNRQEGTAGSDCIGQDVVAFEDGRLVIVGTVMQTTGGKLEIQWHKDTEMYDPDPEGEAK